MITPFFEDGDPVGVLLRLVVPLCGDGPFLLAFVARPA